MSTGRTEKNISIEPAVLDQAIRRTQAEGKTVDELVEDAIKRHLAMKMLERFKREAESQGGAKTEEEIEAIVDTAVQEYRKERSR